MKLHRYVDHQRLHIVTKDVISLSISVLLLFRHYISHKITFGAPSSGGVLRSACGAFITYQIKGITKCSNTVANILAADPLPPPSPGDWVSRSNSTFSEHIKLRKRIANAATW